MGCQLSQRSHVSVEKSRTEKEPELDSSCQDSVVATISDVPPPAGDIIVFQVPLMRICPPNLEKGQCLLTTSCQTQDSGFTDLSVKSTASDVCYIDEAEENTQGSSCTFVTIYSIAPELTQDGSWYHFGTMKRKLLCITNGRHLMTP